jgi:L-amino acid N-acyltransferase YncA
MKLRRATSGDISGIMAIERLPGYEALVGQWSAEQHEAHLGDPAFHYFVAGDAGALTAFVALHAQQDGLLLNRIIVKDTGTGLGRILLQQIIDLSPSLSPSPRIWLRVASHNERAIHLYNAFGFVHETTMAADGRLPNGQTVDLMVMARPIASEIPPQ